MKKTLVFIVGLCTSLSLLAFVNQQHGKSTTISGQVVDKLTGEPLVAFRRLL